MAITESINLMTKHFKNVILACTHARALLSLNPFDLIYLFSF